MPSVSTGVLVVATALALAVAVVAWRNRPNAGAYTLAGVGLAVFVWQAAHLAEHAASGPLELGLQRVQWIGVAPIGFLWLAFALDYVGREDLLEGWPLAGLFAWPVLVVVLVLSPPVVGVVGVSVPDVFPALYDESGLLFWSHVTLSYLALAIGSVLLVGHVVSANVLYQRQGIAVLSGMGFAWGGSFVSVFELFGGLHLHANTAGFALMGATLLLAITETGLTRVTPIAHERVFTRMSDGVVAVDANQVVTDVNPAAATMLDLDADDCVAENLETVLAAYPDLYERFEAATGETVPSEALHTFPAVDDRVVSAALGPLRDRQDRHVGWVLQLRDVTSEYRYQDELERRNTHLDRFADVVSHDLRNPLEVAYAHLELLGTETESDHAEGIEEALDRMNDLIADVLVLSRLGEDIGDVSPVDLENTARRAWQSVDHDDARLVVNGDPGAVTADPGRLRQLLENLFRNSVEHSSTSSRSKTGDSVEHSSTGNDDPGSEPADPHPGRVVVTVGPLGAGLGFYVADDGPGIATDDRERVFDDGFSTNREGTGLGLSIVRRIADAHGWDVTLVDQSGGARFEFRIPEVDATSDSSPGDVTGNPGRRAE